MVVNDLESLLKTFKTVDKVVDIFDGGKSKKEPIFVVKLNEYTNVYEFSHELDACENTEKYIVLTFDDEDYKVGVINGVKDLMVYIMHNFDFDPKTPMTQILHKCEQIVDKLKKEYGYISYKDWFRYRPNINDIAQ